MEKIAEGEHLTNSGLRNLYRLKKKMH